MNKNSNFREDINGLRALAVISVLIFHYSPSLLPAGFIGVDIFFVISGFLMTSIIIRGLEKDEFSFIQFIVSRFKRIVPALSFTIILFSIVGYFTLEPSLLKKFGEHGLSSLIFLSNVFYQKESGYFDLASHTKILLHTWSLSAEWQFYVIYPIALIFLSRFISAKKLKNIIVFSAIILFAYNFYAVIFQLKNGYYLLQFRAWEMLAGGLVYCFPISSSFKFRRPIEFSGIITLIISFYLIDEKTLWPGYMALLPIFGTALCIASNSQKTVFSGYIIQKIGLLSYSIYLMHWPIIAIFKQIEINIDFNYYILLVVFLSALSYYIIEKNNSLIFQISIFVLALFCSGFLSWNGASGRIKNDIYKLSNSDFQNLMYPGADYLFANGNPHFFNKEKGNPKFIIIGDSYSIQYFKFLESTGTPFISNSRVICMMSNNYATHNNTDCENLNTGLDKLIIENPGVNVLWIQNWNTYANGALSAIDPKNNERKVTPDNYYEILSEIISEKTGKFKDRKFYIIGKYQLANYDVRACLAKQELKIHEFLRPCAEDVEHYQQDVNSKISSIVSNIENAIFIDPNNGLCKNGRCKVVSNGLPVFFDNDHLAHEGAAISGKYIYETMLKN